MSDELFPITTRRKRSDDFRDWLVEALVEKGGPGSGNFGHSGRPGEIGGSSPSGSSGKPFPLKGGEPSPVWDKPDVLAPGETAPKEVPPGGKLPSVGPGSSHGPWGKRPAGEHSGRTAPRGGGFSDRTAQAVSRFVAGLEALDRREIAAGHRIPGAFPPKSSSPKPAPKKGKMSAHSLAMHFLERQGEVSGYQKKQKGGPGSGFHGHKGRPGALGGSASGIGGAPPQFCAQPAH